MLCGFVEPDQIGYRARVLVRKIEKAPASAVEVV
jgi:hypothetical protein